MPGSLTAASVPHGLIASIGSNALHIYSADTLSLTQQIGLDGDLAARIRSVKFSPRAAEPRVLLATDTSVHVFDPADADWHVSLANASAPTGRIAHCAFVSGEEVLVFADFGTKATLWNLRSGHGTEIASPKARGAAAYSVRPGSGHLAILARAGNKDTVVILAPGSRRLEASVTLESQDAAGIQWSPDGKWLVAWESAALGPAVWVHTAEGQLFRKWTGSDDQGVHMGVRRVEWDANGDWLLVGTGEKTVVGLRSRTFMPQFTLTHASSISVPASASIWQEQIAAAGTARDYAVAQQPAIPPSGSMFGATSSATGPSAPLSASSGITHLAAAPSGPLLASVCAHTPTTVWIHALPSDDRRAPLTQAVLLHHYPVRTLEWSSDGTQLLIHCAPSASTSPSAPTQAAGAGAGAAGTTDALGAANQPQRTYWAHIYTSSSSSSSAPIPGQAPLSSSSTSASSSTARILALALPPSASPEGKHALTWAGAADEASAVLLSTMAGATLAPVSQTGTAWSGVRITGDGPEDAFDEEEGESGLAGLKDNNVDHEGQTRDLATTAALGVDDTFAFRRGWGTKVT